MTGISNEVNSSWMHVSHSLKRKRLLSFSGVLDFDNRTTPPSPGRHPWLLPLFHPLQHQDLPPRPSQRPLLPVHRPPDHHTYLIISSWNYYKISSLVFPPRVLALHQSVIHMLPAIPFKWRTDHVTDPNPSHYLQDTNLTPLVLSHLMHICLPASLPSMLFY